MIVEELPIMNDLKTIIITHVDDMLKNICKNRESIATSTVNSHLPKLPAPSGADSKSETVQFKKKKTPLPRQFLLKKLPDLDEAPYWLHWICFQFVLCLKGRSKQKIFIRKHTFSHQTSHAGYTREIRIILQGNQKCVLTMKVVRMQTDPDFLLTLLGSLIVRVLT